MTSAIEFMFLPFLACLLLVGINVYFGIHVIKREIIFIDIALAQIVAVGAIAAHLVFRAPTDSLVSFVCSLGTAFTAALFYAWARRRAHQISLEAIIGIIICVVTQILRKRFALMSEGLKGARSV